MISWANATKVLSKKFQEKFTNDFKKYGPLLVPPQMLFKVNSEGFYKPRGNIQTDIQKGTDIINTAMKDLQCQLNEMKEVNQQHQQATSAKHNFSFYHFQTLLATLQHLVLLQYLVILDSTFFL